MISKHVQLSVDTFAQPNLLCTSSLSLRIPTQSKTSDFTCTWPTKQCSNKRNKSRYLPTLLCVCTIQYKPNCQTIYNKIFIVVPKQHVGSKTILMEAQSIMKNFFWWDRTGSVASSPSRIDKKLLKWQNSILKLIQMTT